MLVSSSCWLPDVFHVVLLTLPWVLGVVLLLEHPQRIQPSMILSSFLLDLKGLNPFSNSREKKAILVVGSYRLLKGLGLCVSVRRWMCAAVLVVDDKWFTKCTRSPGGQSDSVVTGWGSQLKASALPRFLPGLCDCITTYMQCQRPLLDP